MIGAEATHCAYSSAEKGIRMPKCCFCGSALCADAFGSYARQAIEAGTLCRLFARSVSGGHPVEKRSITDRTHQGRGPKLLVGRRCALTLFGKPAPHVGFSQPQPVAAPQPKAFDHRSNQQQSGNAGKESEARAPCRFLSASSSGGPSAKSVRSQIEPTKGAGRSFWWVGAVR